MVQERSSPFSVWLAPLVVVLGVMAMTFAARPAAPLGLRPALVFSELALVAPGLLVYLLAGRRARLLGERPGLPWPVALTSILAGVALWVASLGLFELQYSVWKPPPGYLEAFRFLHERLKPAGPLDAIVSVLAIAAAPAVCEELLFRGLVLPSLARPLGAVLATLISTLLFGAIHLDSTTPGEISLYRVPFACAVGVGFAALRLSSGRLLCPMIAHATLNAITFAVAPLSELPADGVLPEARPALGLLLLAPGAIAATLLVRRAARD
jgi:membrane protease YdiL (CAAX protease family)